MTWRIAREEPEGYVPGSGIKPDLHAADGCKECKGAGYLVCPEDHLVVHKQRHVHTGKERIINTSRETCFGHLCRHCQPIRLLLEEKLRQ